MNSSSGKDKSVGSVEEIAEKFHNAASEEKRLAFCIDAINQQVIHNGMQVAEIVLRQSGDCVGTTLSKVPMSWAVRDSNS